MNPGLEEGRGGALGYSDGVNPLDHHLHVLPHGAGLAQSLHHLQEGEAVAAQWAWTLQTAQSLQPGNLEKKTDKQSNTSLPRLKHGAQNLHLLGTVLSGGSGRLQRSERLTEGVGRTALCGEPACGG